MRRSEKAKGDARADKAADRQMVVGEMRTLVS